MTAPPQHPFDAVGAVCSVGGCAAQRASIYGVETYEGRRRKKHGRWATWQHVRLSCECTAGHKYHVGTEQWVYDDQEETV